MLPIESLTNRSPVPESHPPLSSPVHPLSRQHTLPAGQVQTHIRPRDPRARRGAAAVFGVILTATLVVLLAMTLDLGNISVARSELRRSADAAALAACWELFDRRVSGASDANITSSVEQAAGLVAAQNYIANESPIFSSSSSDVQLGRWHPSAPDQFDTSSPSQFNAVRVLLRREQDVNGEVPLFFSKILGRDGQALRAFSVAAMFSEIRGFEIPPNSNISSVELLPIALDLPTWEAVLASATEDNFRMVDGRVTCGSDGFYECNLYPKGNGSPGNRGTVDIGGANNSTADIARQVLTGISDEDMMEFGRPLAFDTNGRLELNGDTGISAGIKDELASIIGQKRIIPIFESVSGNGNNAMYSIVRFEGVRILEVKLTGPRQQKRVIIQPAPMVARGAIVDHDGSAHSDYLYTPVMLVQ